MDFQKIKYTIDKNSSIIIFIVLFLTLMPAVKISSYTMPVLYLLIPIEIIILIYMLYNHKSLPRFFYLILLIFVLISFEIIISTFHGTIKSFGIFIFPRNIVQYAARFLIMSMFFYFGYYNKIKPNTFILYFLIIMNIGMIIGILQWIPWPGREFFISLYPFRDGTLQLSQLNRPLHLIRMHGLAQNATANGGLAAFFLIFGICVISFYKKYKLLSFSLIIVSIINIFASQARAGLLAAVFTLGFFYFLRVYISKNRKKQVLRMIIVFLGIFFTVYLLYKFNDPFIKLMIRRWYNLIERGGGSRVDQIHYFLSQFHTVPDYIFGLSKPVVNMSNISHGVEIEPVNIFVLYGLAGWALQYGLIILLLVYFFRNIKKTNNSNQTLFLSTSSMLGLISYQIFSIGFFFFREIHVGLFPWILIGMTIGIIERRKRDAHYTKGRVRGI